MKIELRFMVSRDLSGEILAGFQEPKDALDYCKRFSAPMRITIAGGWHTLSVEHDSPASLKAWVVRRIGQDV